MEKWHWLIVFFTYIYVNIVNLNRDYNFEVHYIPFRYKLSVLYNLLFDMNMWDWVFYVHQMLNFVQEYIHDLYMKVWQMFDLMILFVDYDYLLYNHELFHNRFVEYTIEVIK
jgi:hypothetical protein